MNYGDFFTDSDYESEDRIHNEQGEFSKREIQLIMGNRRF